MSTPVGPADEPLLDAAEIQGNIVPGFLKPQMAVIALRFGDTAGARRWIAGTVHDVTTLAGAMPSRQAVRGHRLALARGAVAATLAYDESEPLANPRPAGVNDSWLNIALSHRGLATLLAGNDARLAELAAFEDPAFALGLGARSALLGDPTDPTAEGHPSRWGVGAPGEEPDALVIVAADLAADLASTRDRVVSEATAQGLTVLHEERGAKLTARGSEHFGFKDGISQPGVRGRWNATGDPVTPRMVAPDHQPQASLFGMPGQHLVWPGEFIFGYPRESADPLLPGMVAQPGPPWSRNGSYLVYRRLRQDYDGFWALMEAEASRLGHEPGWSGLTPGELGSLLMGRWPSGAPIARAPTTDNLELAGSGVANNYFLFGTDAAPLPLVSGRDDHPPAVADPLGVVCPLASHIRKVNGRDTASDSGGRLATFNRRILRRGLPFGPQRLPSQADDPVHGERGLLFVSYQASISRQFEFLCHQWMGDPTNPRMPSGHDMVVGQNGQPGQRRERHCVVMRRDPSGAVHTAEVRADRDFVIPTGGGYFFSPSISALRDVLGAS